MPPAGCSASPSAASTWVQRLQRSCWPMRYRRPSSRPSRPQLGLAQLDQWASAAWPSLRLARMYLCRAAAARRPIRCPSRNDEQQERLADDPQSRPIRSRSMRGVRDGSTPSMRPRVSAAMIPARAARSALASRSRRQTRVRACSGSSTCRPGAEQKISGSRYGQRSSLDAFWSLSSPASFLALLRASSSGLSMVCWRPSCFQVQLAASPASTPGWLFTSTRKNPMGVRIRTSTP